MLSVNSVATRVDRFSLFLISCVSYSVTWNELPEKSYAFIDNVSAFFRTHSKVILVLCGVALIISKIIKFFFREKHPAELRIDYAVNKAIDDFRKIVFEDVTDQATDHNRVTIFKHYNRHFRIKWREIFGLHWPPFSRWFFSGWLVAIYRSGHVTQRNITCFLAPDDAERTEGIAGRAWRCKNTYTIGGDENNTLPDLEEFRRYTRISVIVINIRRCLRWLLRKIFPVLCTGWIAISDEEINDYLAGVEAVKKYAAYTHAPEAWVWSRLRANKLLPTAITGMILQDGRQGAWGALVLDSKNGRHCIPTGDRKFMDAFRALNKVLMNLEVIP